MDAVEKINQLAQEFMLAESEVSAGRMLGGMGRKLHEQKQTMERVKEEIVTVFKASGYTIKQLEELEQPDGTPAMVYGAIPLLRRVLPYED